MKVLLKTNETLEQAARRHKQFSEDNRAWMAAQARSMFLHDQASKLGDARREGEAKGAKENASETAKRLLKKGMSFADICEVTGLTAEEVEALK
jgi:predicted transposase/invertase (TIGR01784 family)